MNIFTHFFKRTQKDPEALRQEINRDLLRREAAVGKSIFGPVQHGRSREFFRVDTGTWVWQETWKHNGKSVTKITKYNIRAKEVVKSINGGAYQSVTLEEAKNLEKAIHVYVKRVKKEVYKVADPSPAV